MGRKTGMDFTEAFKEAVRRKRIRRDWWNPVTYLTATEHGQLVCWPDIHTWCGPYHVTIDDVLATDWQSEEMTDEIYLEPGDDR
jgi:hypothetical protein